MEKPDALILALDTATSCSTIALTRGTVAEGEVLACLSLATVTHSRKVLTSIDYLLKETGVDWLELAGLAVGLGPGSFTGLRIGMATAKGLAATGELPLLGVSTLDCLAAGLVTDKRVCAVLDARKKEVYAAYYLPDGSGIPRRVGGIIAISPQQLLNDLDDELIMVGDGVISYREIWTSQKKELISYAPTHLHSPNAASLGLLAGEQLAKNVTLDLSAAAPLYVRASDAELNLVSSKG